MQYYNKKNKEIASSDLDNLMEYIKRHYEDVCQLCVLSNIPFCPTVHYIDRDVYCITEQVGVLEEHLNHIKSRIRALELEEHEGQYAVIAANTELCESLSNYRHDLEILYQELKKIKDEHTYYQKSACTLF